ncbi:TonB-dependent receptor [Winogradskyella eckloniae]|uniref:TonB-dependent receptor n=1 Tax=Winogradskyella eckloniae TaxID=1089306 RepID=UPI0015645980|nr:TonB-dependent receptor [Winogradskyella eckloniae]NRD20192.1 TonB-dependent receptor [Winogradskyella eckloniae]
MIKLIMGLVLTISGLSFGQNCSYIFLGELKDFHDGTAIESATIYVKQQDTYLVSDLDGKFKIENLCSDTLTLTISHIGCETKTLSYLINNDMSKTIYLEHHLEELSEVVLNSSLKTEDTSIEKSIHKSVIENFSDKSLGDALNTISGVSSLNTGNTIVKPMIHGLHSSRLLIINNNVRQFDQDWGDEHAPNIDINSSNRIEVIKGANTLRYGSDAIGGLILIKPKKYMITDSLFGNSIVSLNSNGRGGLINTEIVKTYKSGFYSKLQASYKQFGDFKAPDYYLTNSGLSNLNASLNFGFNSFEKGFDAYYSVVHNDLAILTSSHIGNVNDLVTAINSKVPRIAEDFSYDIDYPKQDILHHLAKIEAYNRFKGLGKLTLQYDLQINRRKEFDLRRGDLADTPVIDLRLFTNTFQPNLRIDYFNNLKIDTGIVLRYQQNDAISGTGVRALIPDYEKYDGGIYAIGNYKTSHLAEISAGVRYDYTNINTDGRNDSADWQESYNNISANVSYLQPLKHETSLLFSYGLASRVPNPSELFSDGLHHGAARIEIGALELNKEIAHKFIVSLERHNEQFGFSVSPYYNYINDYIQLIPVGITTTVRGAFPIWEYNQVNAQIFGVDIDVNKKISKRFDYKGSISLLKGDNKTDDIALIHMPSTNFFNSISYKNEDLNQLTIRLNHKTVLQQKRYPDYNFYTYNATLQEDVYVDISSTPSSYALFSLNSSIEFKAFNKGKLQLEFNIENLFNTSYRDYLNRLRYYADELGRNFNLKIKINY